jgi:hypothetical protein
LLLSIEHRVAQGADRLQLALRADPPALALEVGEVPAELGDQSASRPSSQQRIEHILADAKTPMSQRQLRDAARMRASHVAQVLTTLSAI